MKSLAQSTRPRILAIEPNGLSASMRLECPSCGGVFAVEQRGLAGIPLSVHDCRVCGARLEIRPELYELAMHEAGLRGSQEGCAFYAPVFSGTGAGFAKRPISDGLIRVVWAPAVPRADSSLHADLSRRFIAMARLFVAAAGELQGQARFLVRPDNSEVNAAGPEDTGLLVDWLEGMLPDAIEIGLHQDFDLGEADIVVTHVGAPFIEKALRAGKEVVALQLFKRASDENLPEGALAVRDAELMPTLGRVLDQRSSRPKSPTPLAPAAPKAPTSATPGDSSLSVLLAYRSDVDLKGGAAAHMNSLAEALRRRGHRVDVTHETEPDAANYDLVHAFNVWSPETSIQQLAALREQGARIVWSPIYLDLSEHQYICRVVDALIPAAPEKRPAFIKQISRGEVLIHGASHHQPREALPGYFELVKMALDAVDHVCVTGLHEANKLLQHTKHTGFACTVTPNGVNAEAFRSARPGAFVAQFGITDFVLCVGAIETRKNQLFLIEALRGSGRKIVLIGPNHEKEYLQLCKDAGGDDLIITGRLDAEVVASAYAAAGVHVLPSFSEGASLSNLEAAVAGCPMVVSNRSSEFEYFSDGVHYCDPMDIESIRAAIEMSFRTKTERAPARKILAERVAERYTWDNCAALTESVYRSLAVRV